MNTKQTHKNSETGKRIKSLLHEKHTTQAKLAEKMGISEKHLSEIINGRKGLTVTRAKDIAAIFPPVRPQWILALDDYQTEEDSLIGEYQDNYLFIQAVDTIYKKLGYSFTIHKPTSEEQLCNLKYSIFRDGTPVAECSIDDYSRLEEDILAFAKLWIERLCEKGSVDNG